MCHGIVMDEVQFERSKKRFGGALFETDVVIGTDVIHQRVEMIKLLQRLLDGFAAGFRGRDLSKEKLALRTGSTQLGDQFFARSSIVIEKHGYCAFGSAGSHDGRADALCATRHQNYFPF